MINNVAGYMLSIVGAIYIGRLGSLPLSASVLANSVYNCTGLSLALGLSAGMETLCGQVRSPRCPVRGAAVDAA
jgi:MATE family multidrug resistance protein